MTKRSLREKLRRINALAAPDGWDEVNFDIPAWRYVLIGAIVGGMFLAISSLEGESHSVVSLPAGSSSS